MNENSKWTLEEDAILIEAVNASGPRRCWNTIAQSLPGRTNKSCRKRWIHSLDPSLRKGRWTNAEDIQLIQAVKQYGRQWHKVADLLPGRTDDQCAKRWREKLDPSIRRDPWTDAEDLILMEAQEKHGRRWNIISGYLSGRPAVHCRNRWLSLLRAGRITDGIQQAAAMFDTSTLRPVAPGSQSEYLTSPAPSPTPSHSSGFESSLESFFNNWEGQGILSSPKSTEGLPMDLGYYNAGVGCSQHPPCSHHRSGSASSTLSWTSSFQSADFGVGPSLDQASYNQGTSEALNGAISGSSGAGSPSHLESVHSITLTPETLSEPLIMTCSLPYCAFQSTNLTDIWRHMTWDHIGNKSHCPPEMSALVEKVVIGSGSPHQ